MILHKQHTWVVQSNASSSLGHNPTHTYHEAHRQRRLVAM